MMSSGKRRSMYADFLRAGNEGLYHVACWMKTFDADVARLTRYGIGQSGGAADLRSIYFLTECHPGTVVELLEISGRKGQFFKRVADAARQWDGSEPIRRR